MSRGAETRTQILPSSEPKGIDFLGPAYDYSENIVPPRWINVRKEGSFDAVADGIKGVGYYMDTIAFGESSNFLTASLSDKFIRYGVNYFMKNGAKCSNGADAWTYMELIPKGDAFGAKVNQAIRDIGVAPLRGLAPGVIEDAKRAMNPKPLLKSLMGSGYARCEKVRQRVGDELGNIKNTEGGSYIDDPTTVEMIGNKPYQTKWVVTEYIDKAAYDAEPKTMNPDGTPITQAPAVQEGFQMHQNMGFLTAVAIALGLANLWIYKRRY